MSQQRRHWPVQATVTAVKEPTIGSFGVAAMFTTADGTDYVIAARDKATVARLAKTVDQSTEVDEKYFYRVAFIQESKVTLDDDDL